MGQAAKTKTVDSRKPKHSNDSSRPSKTPVGKGGKEHRDASTVSAYANLCIVKLTVFLIHLFCMQVRRLNMYKTRAKRDKKGKVIHEVSLVLPLLRRKQDPQLTVTEQHSVWRTGISI